VVERVASVAATIDEHWNQCSLHGASSYLGPT
jgi:hypothetical protein